MNDLFTRFWQEIAARPGGPLALRFYMQPIVAMLIAIRDGLQDARDRKPAYFWSLLTNSSNRRELLRHGWKSVGKIFVVAVILDLVYQMVVLRGLRPVETLAVAISLAIIPYIVLRGAVNRIVGRSSKPRGSRRAA